MPKKNQILLAALEMFGSQGFHETKIKDIAIKAEVGKGTVYEYFNSKSELLLESIYYALELYIENLETINKANETTKEKFKAIIELDLYSSKYQMNLMHNILKDSKQNACILGEKFIIFKQKRKDVLMNILGKKSESSNLDFINMVISGTISQFILEKNMMGNQMPIDEFTDLLFQTLEKL